VKIERGPGIGCQLRALDAVGIGIEDKAAFIHALEQHHAHIRRAVRIGRGQGHGIRIVGLGPFGFLEPFLKKDKRIGARRDAAIIQGSTCLHRHVAVLAVSLSRG